MADEYGTTTLISGAPAPSATFERVRKIVSEHLGVEPEKVTNSANFVDDLGADSLDSVELVMACEEEFQIEISDDEAERVLTVADMVTVCDGGSLLSQQPRSERR